MKKLIFMCGILVATCSGIEDTKVVSVIIPLNHEFVCPDEVFPTLYPAYIDALARGEREFTLPAEMASLLGQLPKTLYQMIAMQWIPQNITGRKMFSEGYWVRTDEEGKAVEIFSPGEACFGWMSREETFQYAWRINHSAFYEIVDFNDLAGTTERVLDTLIQSEIFISIKETQRGFEDFVNLIQSCMALEIENEPLGYTVMYRAMTEENFRNISSSGSGSYKNPQGFVEGHYENDCLESVSFSDGLFAGMWDADGSAANIWLRDMARNMYVLACPPDHKEAIYMPPVCKLGAVLGAGEFHHPRIKSPPLYGKVKERYDFLVEMEGDYLGKMGITSFALYDRILALRSKNLKISITSLINPNDTLLFVPNEDTLGFMFAVEEVWPKVAALKTMILKLK